MYYRNIYQGSPDATRKYIAKVIMNYDKEISIIRDRYQSLARILLDSDEIIAAVSLSSPALERDHQNCGSLYPPDLADLIDRLQHIRNDQAKDIYEALTDLEEWKTSIERIWYCYCALPEEDYILVTDLYRHKEKWDAIVARYGWSRSTIAEHRCRALDAINSMYCTDLTTSDLARRAASCIMESSFHRNKAKHGHHKQDSCLIEGQLTMFQDICVPK